MVTRLKQLRVKRGVSQLKLADAVGVSQQSINKYENHGVEPDIQTLVALADYFGTSVDYLVGRTDQARIVEPAAPFHLNAEEAWLIESWRQLSEPERESLCLVIKNYLHEN